MQQPTLTVNMIDLALLARPAVAACARAVDVVFVNARHQSPSASGCCHVAKYLSRRTLLVF